MVDDIPYRRLICGVVIVRTEDAGRVAELLKEIGAEVHIRRLELAGEDRDILGARS